jgi:hypothetical protein
MAQTHQAGVHTGLNLDDTDGPRVVALRNKAASGGLQTSERDELKQLMEKGRRPI